MGGGDKKRRQQQAEQTSRRARERDLRLSDRTQAELGERRAALTGGLYGDQDFGGALGEQQTGARELRQTGGYDQGELGNIRGRFNEAATGYSDLSVTGGYSPEQRAAIEGDIGTQRTGYQNLIDTGGFSPEELALIRSAIGDQEAGYRDFSVTGGFQPGERDTFLRRATAPVTASYGRARDAASRRSQLQGGYGNAGIGARLARQGAQEGARASLAGNVELASQERQGRALGLSGLGETAGRRQGVEESLRAGRTRGLEGIGNVRGQEQGFAESQRAGRTRGLEGLESTAGRQRVLESEVAAGRRSGQDALNRVSTLGIAALNQTDVLGLQDRLQSGNISQADAQLLTQLASQDRSLFDNIMRGVDAAVSAVTPFATGGK